MDAIQSAAGAPPLPWRKRHPTQFKWAIGIGVVFTLCAVTALVFGVAIRAMKSSDAYVGAVARAKASPAVVTALGTPLHEGWLVTGNIHVSGPSGLAVLSIPVSGPKGEATIYAEATKHQGTWQFDLLDVEIKATNERIELVPASAPQR